MVMPSSTQSEVRTLPGARVLIVEARFYNDIADALLEGAKAAATAAHEGLDNLCAITDVNALGQSRATMWKHDIEQFARRWRAFGWHTISIDGHDLNAILDAYAEARATKGQPTMIVARTLKGKGISFTEDKDGWHGKALKKGAEEDGALPIFPFTHSRMCWNTT